LKIAFDTVNHKILLEKLNHCGIRGLALNLFTSYLQNRQQFVYANGVQSDKMQITCGVPQGSTLGPLLFLLYINDLHQSSNFFCNIFADDTALLISDNDLTNLEKKTNIELNRVFSLLQKNKLTLNLSKTKFISFNNHDSLITLNINCNNVPLEQVNSTKYLCTIIDSNLIWKEQIASVENKVAQGCHTLFKLQPIFYIKIRKVYFSLIYPHLH